MALTTEIHFIQNLSFEVETRTHHQFMDATKDFGGLDKGPNPKEFLLAGLCGCTGMDVVSLLKKFKIQFEKFNVKASTELSKEHPIVFTEVHVYFNLIAPESTDFELYKKAVTLSMTKYCGVSAMLSKAVPIHYHIALNSIELQIGISTFA